MHPCPECNRHCDCLDGESAIENCAHILTPECSGGDDEEDAP